MIEDINSQEAEKLFAVLLLTDGSVRWNKFKKVWYIQLSNNDISLHKIFKQLGEKAFSEELKTYFKFDTGSRVFISRYSRTSESQIVKKLFNLSPTFTTKYKQKFNPTISFIFNESERIKQLAFRLAMSADGFVGLSHYSNGMVSPRIGLACAHPELAKEWLNLAENLGISMKLDKDSNTWSGIHGIRTTRFSSILKFWNIGGFYPDDVKVTRGNFIGQNKNDVLNFIIQKYS
ncbi:MAG: hypothetical protein QXD43_04670 [Candidatus Aenigmatarchaeota archaeon]